MEFRLYERLDEAYGASSPNNNLFEKAVNAIKWDDTFEADGETYYCKGGLTLTVTSLNPFKQSWRPSVMIGTFMRDLGI